MTQWLVALALSALLAAPAAAFTLVAQEREVSVDITRETRTCPWTGGRLLCNPGPGTQITTQHFADSEAASDLGDFSATSAVPGFDAQAAIVSTAGSTTLSAQGSRSGNPPFIPATLTTVNGMSVVTQVIEHHATASRYQMQFSLSEATSYTLAGQIRVDTDAVFDAGETTRIRLTGPGGAVIELHELDIEGDCEWVDFYYCSMDADVSETGVLAPGTYTLTAETIGVDVSPVTFMLSSFDEGEYDVTLTLTPAPPVIPALPAAGAALLAGLLAAGSRHSRRTPIRTPGGSEASRWRIEGFCSGVWPPRRS
jgi:hypothetical protein